MKKTIPDMYVKNIFFIPYKKLKKEKVKCLVFDLDNTLGMIDDVDCPSVTVDLIKQLKKDFLVVVCSNNFKKRIDRYLDILSVDGVSFACKPFTRGLRKIRSKYNLSKSKMVMIGDQMMTDILSGNRFGCKTILVDPLSEKDLKLTSINRRMEKHIIKKYSKKDIFKRGRYYE